MKSLQSFCFLTIIILLVSCKDDGGWSIAAKRESCRVYMFVTNDAGEDLVHHTEGYWMDGNGRETYRFDEWEAYWDSQLIASSKDDIKQSLKIINELKADNPNGMKNIYLDTDLRIQEILQENKEYTLPHVIEYVVKSKFLFGDDEKHVIKMDFKTTVVHDRDLFGNITYSIEVDGVPQDIFYPKFWNAQPRDENTDYEFPHFILNIDKLNREKNNQLEFDCIYKLNSPN